MLQGKKGKLWAGFTTFLLGTTSILVDDAQAQSGPSDNRLESIVVTAQKREESAQRAPITMSVLDADVLKGESIRILADIRAPSLVLGGTNPGPLGFQVSIRGLSANGSDDGPNGLYLDGVFVGSQYAGGGSSFGSVATMDIQRVEIVYGPQGTLYGRNTTGGAINIITNMPTDEFEGSLSATIGNYDTIGMTGVMSGPIGSGEFNKLSGRLAVRVSDSGPWVTDTGNNRPIGDRQEKAFLATLNYEPTESLQLILRGDYSSTESGGAPNQLVALIPGSGSNIEVALQMGLPTDPMTGFPTQASLDQAIAMAAPFVHLLPTLEDRALPEPIFAKAEDGGVSLTTILDLNDNMTFKSISAYRRNEFSQKNHQEQSPWALLLSTLGPYEYDQLTEELQLSGQAFNQRLDYVVGAYYFDLQKQNFITDIRALPSITGGSVANTLGYQDTRSYALFEQATFHLTDRLSVTEGVRWTTEEKTLTALSFNTAGCNVPIADRINGGCYGQYVQNFDNVSYVVGADYLFTDDLLVYAKVSTGYKAGGTNLGNATPGSYSKINPEELTNYEVGFKSDWLDDRLRVNAAFYHSDYKDIQRAVVVVLPDSSTQILQKNAAEATIDGVELQITAIPFENAYVDLGGHYLKPEYEKYVDDNGTDLSYQDFEYYSEFSLKSTFAYDWILPYGNLRAQVDYFWRSDIDYFAAKAQTDPDAWHIQPAYGLVNGRITLAVDALDLEMAIWGKNIADKRYFKNMSNLSGNLGFVTGTVGAPRTFGLDLTKRF